MALTALRLGIIGMGGVAAVHHRAYYAYWRGEVPHPARA